MNLKINVPVKLVSHNSQFKVKLAEVDTFYDDTQYLIRYEVRFII